MTTMMCESCASEETRLYRVHRRYITPQAWDTPGVDRLLDEVESWCFACCTSYPNVFAETDTGDEVAVPDDAQDA